MTPKLPTDEELREWWRAASVLTNSPRMEVDRDRIKHLIATLLWEQHGIGNEDYYIIEDCARIGIPFDEVKKVLENK